MSETSAAGPSTPDFLAQKRATLGDVVTTHRFAPLGAVGALAGGLSGLIIGGGVTVLEIMGELEKPALGIPFGLAFVGFGFYLLWQLADDVRMRLEVRAHGLVFARAGDERVVSWSDMVNLSWMQQGSNGKVNITTLTLELRDGSKMTLPFERLSNRRAVSGAVAAHLGVRFPEH